MKMLLNLLAQSVDPGYPSLSDETSYGIAWMIVAVAVAGILVIAFKTSGRSHLE